ncbi:MAG: type II toxin-antitoxin system VapC family toxin [Planctomycetota bacterium]|jgi:tRNA(fMet)-specific endonuclease VapC|nr:type II toxin-antitoxin system VapC family toxin [Planctomycetota bacterium]
MNAFVLDANIVSFRLRGNEIVAANIRRALETGAQVLVAPLAYYEVKRGLIAAGADRQLNEFVRFCADCPVGKLDNDILDAAAEIYADLRKRGLAIGDADILIAAFCRKHKFTLVTNNRKHFASIANLPVRDWTLFDLEIS